MKISLYRALLLLLSGVFVVALVPAAIGLDRRLAVELEREGREDLAMGPKLLRDRVDTRAEALRMHAKDLASTPGLAESLRRDDPVAARSVVQAAADSLMEEAILLNASGLPLFGPAVPEQVWTAVRRGESPIWFPSKDRVLQATLAPILEDDRWVGAVGVAVAYDDQAAATLGALTRSRVVVLDEDWNAIAASSEDAGVPSAPIDSLAAWRGDEIVHSIDLADAGRAWVVVSALGDGATVLFSRGAAEATAVLPALRRGALLAGAVALVLALVVSALGASLIARPVRSLANAAERLEHTDFEAPVRSSVIREVDRLSSAFRRMQRSLASRMEELRATNKELRDREHRLKVLQSEMIQQDRLVASGKVVAELAHEIRNPVANVRNCLEVIRRQTDDDAETREFVDLAIEELLRMHGLAEQLLDLNRPMDPSARQCKPEAVVAQVVDLVSASTEEPAVTVQVEGTAPAAAIGPDALKQVLLNVVRNAQEAMSRGGRIGVELSSSDSVVGLEISDEGPGIDPDVLANVFDPFFTTKRSVRGVGLGLFVADGILSRHGGRITARNRTDRSGAVFRIEIPAVEERPAGSPGAVDSGRRATEQDEHA
jgi:signal transduction histidine kinase